ncbi:MAG: succinate--CoA ligase subunit alpha [Desulfobacterales bacterium]|nr:succinate--CoA ligase subunit alpha [Desulfobacteraceae bacterium]MBT7085107.1 succinate--CoA ligase subunit alpha [Desulfobacterales bacterium]MBT7697748.1 succinate--CoA ligase subunit alpha [Desulfobacterales bacterium]
MSIFVNKDTRLLVQGITGKEGEFHTLQCDAYGTNVVGGVTPGKAGQKVGDIPVFNTVSSAVKKTGANASMIFVPPAFAADAIMEAVDSEIEVIVCITEGVPVLDMMRVKNYLKGKKSRLIGPNCPGIITPGECKIGIMPAPIHKPGGPIGVISRSGTLTYEVVDQLTKKDIGQTTCIGIGGDPVNGTNFIDVMDAFQKDPETKGIVMVGEIGGTAEEEAAVFIKNNVTKPVIGFIAGLTAPPGRRMGHAGAIISGSSGTGQGKIAAMRENGIHVCENLGTLGELCVEVF